MKYFSSNDHVQAAPGYFPAADFTHKDNRWQKDEILAAKIKKFLSVSVHFRIMHVSWL